VTAVYDRPIADTITALLDGAARGGGTVAFLDDDRVELPFDELWRRAEHTAAYFLDTAGAGGTVAVMMETSPDGLATLLGAMRAGLTVLSLPFPARGTGLDEYTGLLAGIGERSGAAVAALPPRFAGLLPDPPLPVVSHEACAAHPRRADVVEPCELVQFSSGSTGQPRGVRLDALAIAANVVATLERLPSPLVGCSWLPLSHDMGLIGMCFCSLVSMGAPWEGGRLALMAPEAFVRRPSRWLLACSELGATLTCTPNFGLDLVLRHAGLLPAGTDLRRLASVIVGSEPIRPSTLRRFAQTMAPAGFDETALSPAYGMAEAALAVSIVRPGDRWRALAAPESDGREVVSCGLPLRGVEVRAPDVSVGAGPIAIRGATLLSGYLGEPDSPLRDGWLETRDLGFVAGGEVFVVGRSDDVIMVAGRKLYPDALEVTAEAHPALRAGNCAAIPDDSGGYVIVAERSRAEPPPDLAEVCRWVRTELATRHGVSPAAVTIVSPGTLPKTPSGKLQRRRLRQLRGQDGLLVEADLRFGPGPVKDA
jgi:acyl-CoA synthetase (AMP-forming)/AMP-acid ligase II